MILALILAVVSTPTNSVPYACDGVTAAYTINFPYQQASDITVTSTTAGGVTSTLNRPTDYALSVTSTQTTALLTLTAPGASCPNGNTLRIARILPLTQLTTLSTQSQFLPQAVMQMVDRTTMQIQQLNALYTNPPATVLPVNITAKLNGIRFADQFANIQAAITDAGTLGAVIIPPGYVAADTFVNPNNIPIIDLRNGAAGWRGGVNVQSFGAVGNDSADDTAKIQSALNACNGGRLDFVLGATYRITAALTVTNACKIWLNGATVHQTTANTGGFTVSVGGVEFIGPGTIAGPQFALNRASEIGILVSGASAASPLAGFKATNVTVKTWGMYAIYGTYVTDIALTRNTITNIFYGGTLWISAIRGVFANNVITNVTGNIGGNSYGLALTRNEVASLVTDPPSSDITVVGNVVKNVPTWECYDTHTGVRITFANNVGYGCPRGISVGPDNTGAAAPHDVSVTGNVLDSGVTDGSAQYGIAFVGVTAGDQATGSVSGNVVRGYGNDVTVLGAAVYVHDTVGLSLSGNSIIAPSPTGILAYTVNAGLSISGGSIIDAWSTAQPAARGVYVNSVNQTVSITGVSFELNGKAAAHVGDRAIDATAGALAGVYIDASHNHSAYTLYKSNFGAQSTSNGLVTLAAGTATKTVMAGVACTCADTTAVAACKPAVVGTTLTLTGTGTDTIAYNCN